MLSPTTTIIEIIGRGPSLKLRKPVIGPTAERWWHASALTSPPPEAPGKDILWDLHKDVRPWLKKTWHEDIVYHQDRTPFLERLAKTFPGKLPFTVAYMLAAVEIWLKEGDRYDLEKRDWVHQPKLTEGLHVVFHGIDMTMDRERVQNEGWFYWIGRLEALGVTFEHPRPQRLHLGGYTWGFPEWDLL